MRKRTTGVKQVELYVPRASFIIIKVKNVKTFMEEFFVKEYPVFRVPPLEVNGAACQSYSDYGPIHWIIIRKDAAHSTISHECIHVVDYLCNAYGIDDTEFRGYLMGYLVEQILKK